MEAKKRGKKFNKIRKKIKAKKICLLIAFLHSNCREFLSRVLFSLSFESYSIIEEINSEKNIIGEAFY
jgi:hypothetical protein